VCAEILQGVQTIEPFKDSRGRIQEESAFYTHGEAQGSGARWRRKPRAWRNPNSFKRRKKAPRKLRRSSVSRQIGGRKRSGPLKNLRPGGTQEEPTIREGPTVVGSHEEIPSVVGLGRVARRLASGRGARKEEGSEPSDREQVPVSHWIYGSFTRFSHRDIGHREIGVLEVV
jgi:hypothetical protein